MRVIDDADDKLGDSARHHPLDIQAGAETNEIIGGGPDRIGILQIEPDGVLFGFVGDAERLEGDRIAECVGDGDGLQGSWRSAVRPARAGRHS